MNTVHDLHGRAAPAATRRSLAAWLGANGLLGLAVAALLGLGFAWWLYGYPMLRGTSPFWWRDNADITQYLAGFNAYVHEPWHWPLLRMESLNTPDGTLATFLDTTPLYALVLKLVHPGQGYWNPYGLWIALCFTLQGVGAWWICREARVRSWPALVALALLLASFPALTFRISHTSLMSQWLLVFALAVYIRSTRLGRLALGAWTGLLVGAFYLNIYLFAMASALFAADVLRHRRPGPLSPASAMALLRPMAIVYGLLFATMWLTMLPLPPGAGKPEWGYGYYSMNLLAPFNGGRVLEFPHPIAYPGQDEGYNYLGVFVLALAAYAYRLRRRFDPGHGRRHRALLAMLVLLTLYAVTNVVYLGEAHLFTLHVVGALDKITSTFRTSGRFFWPVGYAVVVFAVLGIARHLGGMRAGALLLAVVALHLWDLGPHHKRVRATAAQAGGPVLDAARWDAFLGAGIKALHYYPPFHCDATPASDALLPVMGYAVRHGYPLSTGYIARASKPCDGFGAEIARLPASTAVAFEKKAFPQEADAHKLMPDATCADMNIVFLCRRNSPNLTEANR